MIHGDKMLGAPLLGMRSLRAWLCPCLPQLCGGGGGVDALLG